MLWITLTIICTIPVLYIFITKKQNEKVFILLIEISFGLIFLSASFFQCLKEQNIKHEYETLKNYRVTSQLENTFISRHKQILNTKLIDAKISIDKYKYLWIFPKTIQNLEILN